MPDDPRFAPLPDLPRPEPPPTWGERIAGWAESLDLTPTRLVVGLLVLAAGGFVAWRLMAPPPLPPEMELPFASSTVVSPAAGVGAASGAGGGAGGAGGPGGGPSGAGAAAAQGAGSPGGAGGAAGAGGRVGEVIVHVAGAVVAPGVQHLAADARVVDAVEAAGGATADAELARINLAAPLEDGQQVYVPRLGEPLPPPAAGGAPAGGAGGGGVATGAAGGASGGLVDLNRATLDELDELPGVGPAIAQAIVDFREQQGPFTSVDQLLEVRGIGDARLAELRDRVTV